MLGSTSSEIIISGALPEKFYIFSNSFNQEFANKRSGQMVPFKNFDFFKAREGVLKIEFDYTFVVSGYDHALVLVVEQDGDKDQWSLRTRNYIISTASGAISSTRLAFFNESFNDWLTIPENTSGDRDDHGRRLFLKALPKPLGAERVEINAYYDPRQIDQGGSGLEFYALVGIVAAANGHPVALLGDHFVTPTLTNV
jgi:hypothetical protein